MKFQWQFVFFFSSQFGWMCQQISQIVCTNKNHRIHSKCRIKSEPMAKKNSCKCNHSNHLYDEFPKWIVNSLRLESEDTIGNTQSLWVCFSLTLAAMCTDSVELCGLVHFLSASHHLVDFMCLHSDSLCMKKNGILLKRKRGCRRPKLW